MRRHPSILHTVLALSLLLFAPLTARAGDFAQRHILGFSPDGRYFAFEQFGTQDGSGFPYADIFLIDTEADSWTGGAPWRVLLRDERAEVKWARREVLAKAGNALRKYLISAPGTLLASNPAAELSADPHAVSVNPRFAVPGARETFTFRLQESPLPAARCRELLGGPAKGFSLTLTVSGQGTRILHADSQLPQSRGCPLRYAISDVVMHEPKEAPRAFAILISVYSYGFEGADRRFIAVTFRQR
ncbi:MAG: DUF2259 domain-containing protein [Methyloligellaceae bacterium]